MDLRQLKRIMKEFEQSSIHKMEITEKDFTVKLEKKGEIISSIPTPVSHSYNPTEVINPKEQEVLPETQDYTLVKAPLVGTFYDSPSPDSDAFVKTGQTVNKGDVLFIVEAMKVMNEITSPVTGVVKKINVENSTMVEFGQVVMEIEE